jgi:putative two-component system response regulator
MHEPARHERILIVDDHPANVRLLERILARENYSHVRSTDDARHVASLCREFRPDLVLLDLNMPHIDGFELMKELKAGERPSSTIVISGDATSEAKERALAEGADQFLPKPFDRTELLRTIAEILDARSA